MNSCLRDLTNRWSSLVSNFKHSSTASDALKGVQREMGTKVLQPSRGNDTMYACAFAQLLCEIFSTRLRLGFKFSIELES